MYVGNDAGFINYISLMEIDLPPLQVETVEQAVLRLSVIVKTGADPSQIVANRVTSPFDATDVTFETIPGYETTASQIDINISDLYATVEIDITELVNQWLNETYPNYGIALTNPDGVTMVQFGTNNIVYEPYFPKLVITYSDTPVPPPPTDYSYGYIYNTDEQSVSLNIPIKFSNNGTLPGITHEAGTAPIIIESAGLYAVWYTVTAKQSSQFTLFRNGNPVPGSTYGSYRDETPYPGIVIIYAAAGDQLTLRNYSSDPLDVTLYNEAGGDETSVSASVMILKISEAITPDPILDAVNNAQDITQMRDAITDPVLGLNLDVFNTMSTVAQDMVLGILLTSKSDFMYQTVQSLQGILDKAVNETSDPGNIQLQSSHGSRKLAPEPG